MKIHLCFAKGKSFVCPPWWKKIPQPSFMPMSWSMQYSQHLRGFYQTCLFKIHKCKAIFQHIASFVPLEYMHELLCIFDLRPGYFPHIFSPIRREVSVAGWPLPPKVLNCLNFLPLSPVQAVVCYP